MSSFQAAAATADYYSSQSHLDEDYSSYFSFFQEAAAPTISGSPPLQSGMPNRRRILDGNVDVAGGDLKRRKPTPIAKLLTSSASIDAQEEANLRESAEASRREISLLEENRKRDAAIMLDHYSQFQDHFSAVEDEDSSFRSKRVRLATNAAAAAAVSDGEDGSASSVAEGRVRGGNQQRRLWVKERSGAWWDRCDDPNFPEGEFRRAFRMSRATFDMICEELGSAVQKADTTLRTAVPVRKRVAVCIWRLATGEPLRDVSARFGLGISTCHKLVFEVCTAIKTLLMPRFVQWPEGAAAADAKSRFEAASRIPNVVGSMYTTHIPIIAPKVSVAAYFNRRHTERNQKTSYSVTVQGVVNPDGMFSDVCIGWPGSMPDDEVLEKSALYKRAAAGALQNAWIVGGSGYPLTDWVLVPYTHQNLTWTQHAFNEKIGEVQRVAREAFAKLKGRWTCLQKRTEVKLQDLPVFIAACCTLHNICEMNKEEMDEDMKYELMDDEMMPENSIRSASASNARDKIAHNLLHQGLAGTGFF
ncbi:hypothetical protein Cni_G09043 [Canna indica]|uniref:DDE Tnp4 domain-containing protein n=1 Tax=Canna indica TaxID=4628 RepID=A0AAQ3Q989_9LILI|nr:hypothetical protein Cni_G09043 [Canna indica]